MEDGTDFNRDEIFSKAVRAGKRTYFFDVKTTRGNDFYLTITESKRRYDQDGKFFYEKHKLFLYKEDFEKFAQGLTETIDKIAELRKNSDQTEVVENTSNNGSVGGYSTDVNFEDLGDSTE